MANVMQASSAYSMQVQGWLREEALQWATRIDTDIAAKEKDTETTKQERQRDLIKLKVPTCHPPTILPVNSGLYI